MTFSNYGHGVYMANATEVQKFSISSEFMRQLPEMTGRVFTEDVPMPEPPKPGFLKGASSFLFGSGKTIFDFYIHCRSAKLDQERSILS